MKHLVAWRRLSQLVVLALFCVLPLLNASGYHEVSGSLFAFDFFGLPFADPASALQSTTSGGLNAVWPLFSFYLGAFVTLGVALLFGRIFCGWLCPYGLFSDLVYRLRKKEPAGNPLKKLNITFWLKALFLIFALVLAALASYPLITALSMPGQISLLPYMAVEGIAWGILFSLLALPVAALLFELITGRRLWCASVCPQSVLLGLSAWSLPGKAPGLRIAWSPSQCTCGKKSPCRQACTLGLNPRQRGGPSRRDCVMCGDCVAACERNGGALRYKLGAARAEAGNGD